MKVSNLVEQMLTELASGRAAMTNQTSLLGDIIEKSNSVLLQIESMRSVRTPPTTANSDARLCLYKKETKQALANIIIKAQQTLSCREGATGQRQDNGGGSCENVEEYLQYNRQRMELLGSNVRKLIAVNDTVDYMKANLEEEDGEESDTDAAEEEQLDASRKALQSVP